MAVNAQSTQSPCKNKVDCLVLGLHALMKMKQFKLVSIGESSHPVDQDAGKLPATWNETPGVYVFQYKHDQSKDSIVVKALSMYATLSVQCTTLESPNVVLEESLDWDDFVKDLANYSKLTPGQVYKNVDKLTKLFIDQMIAKLVPALQPAQPSNSTKATPPQQPANRDPLRVDNRPTQRYPPSGYRNDFDDPIGNFGVGGDDLNPFSPPGRGGRPHHIGGFGGGSEIGPHHPGFGPNVNDPYSGGGGGFPGVPQAGRGRGRGDPTPPGGRFDPFGPTINPHGDPDNDELPPPGYGNMFM